MALDQSFRRPSYTRSLRARVSAARVPGLPSTRISDTLVSFAQPALDELGPDSDLEQVKQAYEVVIAIWNAHVLAMPAWGAQPELERLAARMASGLLPTHMTDLFVRLSQLRQESFADDPRYVSSFAVERDPQGRIHLGCEAKVPAAMAGA